MPAAESGSAGFNSETPSALDSDQTRSFLFFGSFRLDFGLAWHPRPPSDTYLLMSRSAPQATPLVQQDDPAVVGAAQQGDRQALTELVARHRPWVYNIALRMMGDAGAAEDAMQEIFLKAIAGLGSFEGRSEFRTWLYRVAFHYPLNAKRTRSEEAVGDFDHYAAGLAAAPDLPLDAIAKPEREALVEKAKTACMTGMLLYLSREQRMVYVLGAVLDLSDTLAADLLGITPATFRKRLQRARTDLHNFMNGNCGLINENNRCRCAKKTRAFFEAGHLDRHELKFQRDRIATIG